MSWELQAAANLQAGYLVSLVLAFWSMEMEVLSALRRIYGGLDEVTQMQILVQCPYLEASYCYNPGIVLG